MSAWESHRSLGTPPVKPMGTRTCPNCTRPMVTLFYSLSCNHCENPPKGEFYVGFIAYDEENRKRPSCYVWSTAKDAAEWGQKYPTPRSTLAVLSPTPFLWTLFPSASGAFHTEDFYEIYPNHRYVPRECRAFLAPPFVSLNAYWRVYL
jgi:hypothetical protein